MASLQGRFFWFPSLCLHLNAKPYACLGGAGTGAALESNTHEGTAADAERDADVIVEEKSEKLEEPNVDEDGAGEEGGADSGEGGEEEQPHEVDAAVDTNDVHNEADNVD